MSIENITVSNIDNSDDILKFELVNVNISIANSLRRIILSEIPCVVFKTSPYEESKAEIDINTTRMNNELIKQRLSCIPIHINDRNINIDNLVLEIDEKNDTDSIKIITTKDFKITDKQSKKNVTLEIRNAIFPPDKITNNYIDFVRLMPKTSITEGEQLKLTCDFSISNAKDDSMFNVVSNCSYGFTKDNNKVNQAREQLETVLREKYDDQNKIKQELKDFDLLTSQRYFKQNDEGQPNSFDFIIETIGIYTNFELVTLACDVLIEKLNNINEKINSDDTLITKSNVTINNCYDILLKNEDYTLGKIIEYIFYEYYYKSKESTFVGFIKQHPHIDESVIRIAFDKKRNKDHVKSCFNNTINMLIEIYTKISNEFIETKKNYSSIQKLKQESKSKEKKVEEPKSSSLPIPNKTNIKNEVNEEDLTEDEEDKDTDDDVTEDEGSIDDVIEEEATEDEATEDENEDIENKKGSFLLSKGTRDPII